MPFTSSVSRAVHAFALATLMLAGQAATAAAPPPAEAFFNRAGLQGGTLSPSGRYIAFSGGTPEQRRRLIVVDTQSDAPPQVIAYFDSVDIAWFEWLSDERLLFSVADTEDAESYRKSSGLFVVKRDGTEQRVLIKRDIDSLNPGRGNQPLEATFRFAQSIAGNARQIIVTELRLDAGYDYSHETPWLFDVESRGRRLLLVGDPPHPKVQGWWFDRFGRARAAVALDKGETIWFYSPPGDGKAPEAWREIARFKANRAEYTIAYVGDDDRLLVTAMNPTTGFEELREFDLAAGRPKDQAIVATPGYDARVLRLRDGGGQTVGLRVKTDDWETAWQLPAMKALQQKVDRMLPGRVNLLSCRGCEDAESVLVFSYSDRQPGEYLYYNGKKDAWQKLGSVRPTLDERTMGRTQLLHVPARDGLELPVWVTAPAGIPPKALPTIVLAHGGPWVRGRDWGFETEAQFLASRGYLVIESEFRGSTGFGDKHYRAGWKQWGKRMQDDLADALGAAVAKGWADPRRVCIAGASYGGYATLMGLAKQGDLFRCGVAWVGVSDPRLLFSVHWSDTDRDTKKYTMPELIGDPDKDAADLGANAPIELAAQIKAPLLLAYGGLDRRVPLVHGEKMRDALKAAGHPPQYIVYDDEGHGWRRPVNQIDFWKRVERFLDQNLKQ